MKKIIKLIIIICLSIRLRFSKIVSNNNDTNMKDKAN